jgi:hypothetical protein
MFLSSSSHFSCKLIILLSSFLLCHSVDFVIEDNGAHIAITHIPSKPHLFPEHNCFEARNGSSLKSIEFCLANAVVAGVGKCGTSALHHLFSLEPRFYASNKKENCLRKYSKLPQPIWGYLKSLDDELHTSFKRFKQTNKCQTIVSGCIYDSELIKVHDMLHLDRYANNTKYIVQFRDFADWNWAAYNYWTVEGMDAELHIKSALWATKKDNYRSADMFHEILTAAVQDRPLGFRTYKNIKDVTMFRDYGQRCEKAFGRDTVFFAASEWLEAAPMTYWEKLMRSFGFPNTYWKHSNIGNFTTTRVNTGDAKGADTVVAATSWREGEYEISEHKPLRNDTRAMIYQLWQEECLWASEVTGWKYRACHVE